MQIIEVQFSPWDQKYFFLPPAGFSAFELLKNGVEVIAETTLGTDLGVIVGTGEFVEGSLPEGEELKAVARLANAEDCLQYRALQNKKEELLNTCRNLIRKYNLDMGLVDVRVSFDDARLTYAFTSDARVDFRELVKELIKLFHKNVRLQQIGVRDAAKFNGDLGPCGRPVCCHTFLNELGNVSTDCAKCQQITNRGSDRLSGVCNRLKCCLRYEQPVYEELSKHLPLVGSKIKTKQGEGVVVGLLPLKSAVTVSLDAHDGERNKLIEVEIQK